MIQQSITIKETIFIVFIKNYWSIKWKQLRMSNTPEKQNEKQHRFRVERSQFVR